MYFGDLNVSGANCTRHDFRQLFIHTPFEMREENVLPFRFYIERNMRT